MEDNSVNMIKTYQKCYGLILISFFIVGFYLCCDDNPLCDEYDYPKAYPGYWEVSRFQDGDYRTITFTNDHHWVTWTSLGKCEEFKKSEYWG